MNWRACSCLLVGILISQTIRAQTWTVGVGGGVALIEGKNNLAGDMSHLGSAFKPIYSVSGTVGYSLAERSVIWTGGISYFIMRGEGVAKSELYSQLLNGRTTTRSHLLSLTIGPRWPLNPGPVSLVLGIHLVVDSFGDITRNVKSAYGTSEYSISGGFSYGVGGIVGADVHLFPRVSLYIDAVFNLDTFLGGIYSPLYYCTVGANGGIRLTID